jgi:hypothetical protein
MICVDNYRLMHGRDGYRDPERRVLSIWGWSTGGATGHRPPGGPEWLATGQGMGYGMLQDANSFNYVESAVLARFSLRDANA